MPSITTTTTTILPPIPIIHAGLVGVVLIACHLIWLPACCRGQGLSRGVATSGGIATTAVPITGTVALWGLVLRWRWARIPGTTNL